MIGISKKSLDDYLLQLRFGKKFNFDFEGNKDCKIGKLRLYVKQERLKVKEKNGNQKISSKTSTMDGEDTISGVARAVGFKIDQFDSEVINRAIKEIKRDS